MVQQRFNSFTITIPDSERQPCEVWSRVMGYYRPVADWNPGKQQEFRERVMYDGNRIVGEQ